MKIKRNQNKSKERNLVLRKKLHEAQIERQQAQARAEKLSDLSNNERRKEAAKKITRMSNKRQNKVAPLHAAVSTVPPNIIPSIVEYPVPKWFVSSRNNVDVSIVVPMYRSRNHIKKQIETWDFTDDGIKKEIIYVDDCCPDKSHIQVLESWEQQKSNLPNGIGRMLLHNRNGGFAFACNAGAKFSSGKYLIFLNADCEVTPNWIKPMIDLMESNPLIGIVGNLQVGPGGKVDSAGSEWIGNSFKHIGRNVYQGKFINTAFEYNNMPEELKCVGERQMVTGACFAIRSDVFRRVQGFDTVYKIGYWEDADLNMKVKSLGLKIYYQPNSVIYHKCGHSRASGHKFIHHNQEFFYNKWVSKNNFKALLNLNESQTRNAINEITQIDFAYLKKKIIGKIVGCVIACNEEEFIEASVESLSPIIDQWIFVIGGNEYAYKSGMCNQNGYPTDNTMDIVRNLVSKYGGKIIEPHGLWKNKIIMRNSYAELLNQGDWMFQQDADEVYDQQQLLKIIDLMIRKYNVVRMQYWSFWNNVHTLGTGKWDNYPCERVVKWQTGFKYKGHLNVSTSNGELVMRMAKARWVGNDRLFYHYSWIRPIEKLRQKLLYYKYQSGNNNDSYIDDVFLKWRIDPESVRGKTHPMGGGDFEPFLGKHPPQIEKLIQENKLNF